MAARNLDLPEARCFIPTAAAIIHRPSCRVLKELGITQLVGRTGICYDNALSESVNGTLKNELVYRTAYAPANPQWMVLRGGSSFAIIGLVSTPRSGTGLRKRF